MSTNVLTWSVSCAFFFCHLCCLQSTTRFSACKRISLWQIVLPSYAGIIFPTHMDGSWNRMHLWYWIFPYTTSLKHLFYENFDSSACSIWTPFCSQNLPELVLGTPDVRLYIAYQLKIYNQDYQEFNLARKCFYIAHISIQWILENVSDSQPYK